MTVYVFRDGTEIKGTDHEIIQAQQDRIVELNAKIKSWKREEEAWVDETNALRLKVHRLTNLLQEVTRSQANVNSWCKIIESELTGQRGEYANAMGILSEEKK